MNTVIQTRIDTKTKEKAEAILGQLGISLNDGIRMFINQVNLNRGIPFTPALPKDFPNEETKKIIRDTDKGINCAKFDNAQELFDDLGI